MSGVMITSFFDPSLWVVRDRCMGGYKSKRKLENIHGIFSGGDFSRSSVHVSNTKPSQRHDGEGIMKVLVLKAGREKRCRTVTNGQNLKKI